METVLVTGAGGYIGTTLVPMLLNDGYKVKALDRFFFGNLLPQHSNLEIIKEDSRKIDANLFNGVDHVIDLVAISNDPSGELFQNATWEINHWSRANTAKLAKQAGVKRYIMPSSCSIYGFQENGVIANETTKTNPLTTYAKANEKAEQEILPLADSQFCAVVLRQATVYGYSPRMRFDLAINGMTYGAWKTGVLPLMRDGRQWRPMVHVTDTARAQILMLKADVNAINGQIFNVGSKENTYQLGQLAEIVASVLPKEIKIEWYGDPDHRSYRVAFDKIEKLGYKTLMDAKRGALEVYEALESKKIDKTTETITLQWYQDLVKWQKIIKEVELYHGIININ